MTDQACLLDGSLIVLPPDHVLVSFNYAPTPPKADLKRTYKGDVSCIFDGRPWDLHMVSILAGTMSSCKSPVWLAVPPHEVLKSSERIIAWGYRQRTEIAPYGYRPIMGQNELLDLHRAHPKLCKQFWMPALGSFALDDNVDRYVAVLGARDGKPALAGDWFGGDWDESRRFPFVPQVSA